jgi:arginyl-tRNA--protein-N-Asp/Glu arginylyltransferase
MKEIACISNQEMAKDPNHFSHYIVPDLPEELAPQKIKYTIHLHRAMYTEEFFEIYKRYEMHVHGKEREPEQVKRFLCNSPVYDPVKEPEFANTPSALTSLDLDA